MILYFSMIGPHTRFCFIFKNLLIIPHQMKVQRSHDVSMVTILWFRYYLSFIYIFWLIIFDLLDTSLRWVVVNGYVMYRSQIFVLKLRFIRHLCFLDSEWIFFVIYFFFSVSSLSICFIYYFTSIFVRPHLYILPDIRAYLCTFSLTLTLYDDHRRGGNFLYLLHISFELF